MKKPGTWPGCNTALHGLSRFVFSSPVQRNQITNRLLYQPSYVGLRTDSSQFIKSFGGSCIVSIPS